MITVKNKWEARFVAKSLNCERKTQWPCHECDSCLLIDAGTHLDILELDCSDHFDIFDSLSKIRECLPHRTMRSPVRVVVFKSAGGFGNMIEQLALTAPDHARIVYVDDSGKMGVQ